MRPYLLAAAVMLSVPVVAGCNNSNDDPESYVTGLRLLAVKAEPPEVPVGGTTTLTALALETSGAQVGIAWAQCVDPPEQRQTVNPDCLANTSASYLLPVGSGLSVMATMPMVDPTTLGRPDASDGVYLPIVAQVSAQAASGAESLTSVYLLRFGLGLPPNQNPMLSDISQVTGSNDAGAGGVTTPLDDSTPLVVHAGDELTLRATFAPGSAESYSIYDGDPTTTPPRSVTETLSVTWFSTAGTFSAAASGADVPDTVLHLDQTRNGPSIHLPASGTAIDLWVVGHDERGGTDYLHRTLQFE